MKKRILILSLILAASLVLGGCGKKTIPESINSNDFTQDESDTNGSDSTIPVGDQDLDTNDNAELDVTKEDLEKLKSDINSMEFEDLSTVSQ